MISDAGHLEDTGFDLLGYGKPLKLVHQGVLRRSASFKNELEVQCVFLPLDAVKNDYVLIWLSYAKFGFYPMGTIFDGSLIRHPDNLQSSAIGNLVQSESTYFADRQFVWRTAPFPDKLDHLPGHPRREFIDRTRNPIISVSAFEIARFYLSAISLMADDLLSLDHALPKVLNRICNMGRSKEIGERSYRIAPRFGYLSRSCAKQSAMLIGCPRILDYWRLAIAQLRVDHSQKKFLDFIGWFPDEKPTISAHLVPTLLMNDDDVKTILTATQILSETRALPFDHLQIELPFGVDEELFKDAENEEEDAALPRQPYRYKTLSKWLNRNDYLKPSLRGKVVAAAGRTLVQSFPAYENVEIEIVRQRLFMGPPQVRKERVAETVSDVAIGKKSADGEAASIRHRFIDKAPLRIRGTADYSQDLAPSSASEYPLFVGASSTVINNRFKCFFDAARAMQQRGMLHEDQSSLAADPPLTYIFLEFPRSWGIWGWCTAKGRGRRAAYMQIEIDGAVIWVLELECLTKYEKFPVGLIHARDVRDPEEFLTAYLAAMDKRLSKSHLSDGLEGPWPTGSFNDVDIERLVHTRRRLDGEELAKSLFHKSRYLLDKARRMHRR
jgi:hypothetical protein